MTLVKTTKCRKMKHCFKLFGLMAACLLANVSVQAQDGVKFVENATYAQVLAQAKQENKLLFIDCYTSWCGPCKRMSNEVFPQKVMGDYFNPKFVSVKFDMEKGEGPALKTKFSVRAFPTFLVIDPNTDSEVTRFVGSTTPQDFIKSMDNSLKAGGLKALKAKYESGNREPEFVKSYIQALSKAYMQDESAKVASEFMKGKESQLLNDSELFDMFYMNITSPKDEMFQYVWKNKDEFLKKYGEKVENKFEMTWRTYPTSEFITPVRKGKAFDEAGFKEYVQFMKDAGYKDYAKSEQNVYVLASFYKKDYPTFFKLAQKFDKKYGANDMEVYNWCMNIEKDCKDKAIRQDAAKWVKNRIAKIDKEEAEAKAKEAVNKDKNIMPAMSMVGGPAFKKYYQTLLEKFEKDN
jgi:thiol-disulfide isomerase/thioredoxin